jgi:hypothetical protein
VKALVVLVVAAAALAAASAVAAGNRVVERGIVQSVEPSQVVLRALDGTDVTIAVGPATRVRLNGQPTMLASILRGYVAEAVTAGNGPAIVIRAFGRIEQGVEIGRLVRMRPRALVVRSDAGTVRIGLGARTRVWRAGKVVRVRTLRPGMRVQVVRGPSGGARVVLVLAPGSA